MPDEEKMKELAEKMREAENKGLTEEQIKVRDAEREKRRLENIRILEDTLGILEKGSYEKDGKEINLRFSVGEMEEAKVYLPEDIEAIEKSAPVTEAHDERDISRIFGCENEDALVLAKKRYLEMKEAGDFSPKVLVLNLASATEPGGRTRKGASAQEEDLCRRSSLLLSLESENAKKYYDYNNAHKTHMGSDGIVMSENVEVIKNHSSETLAEPFPISVMSCSAPMIRMGLEGMTQEEYESMLETRIRGMLTVAATEKYRHLILGAFGCGIYGNDASLVSRLFYEAIMGFSYAGKPAEALFDSIDFAVLCKPEKDYNYKEFCRYFS
ncbi:MAG: TIGR02452 family protein [Oscillospiraceae bacterium]|nr:TIGR02452 family protein [Oscillospiraceae bacterium]